MRGGVIAILGAARSGKTTLAHALALELRSLGCAAEVAAEPAVADRTVRQASAHWQRLERPAAAGTLVLADTTPLLWAVLAPLPLDDPAIAAAAGHQARCLGTLLLGGDLAGRESADREPAGRGPAGGGPCAVEARLRATLGAASLPFAVVYGHDGARTAAALAALRPLLGLGAATAGDAAPRRLGRRCDECLQPQCEHLSMTTPTLTR